MGGHAAWRKRVARGELAKGAGGAALRHRPRWGRRGADLALNRKGNLGGHGNPKKNAKKRSRLKGDCCVQGRLSTKGRLFSVAVSTLCLVSLVACTSAAWVFFSDVLNIRFGATRTLRNK